MLSGELTSVALIYQGLVVLTQVFYLTNTMGIEPTYKDGKMVVVFNGKYNMIFSEKVLEEFYQCLCAADAFRCSFKFQSLDNEHLVTETFKFNLLQYSSLLQGNAMVCRTSLLSNLFQCKLEKLDSHGCPRESTSGFHRLEFFDHCGRQCINLCWHNFNVTYTSTSSRAVPEPGVCPSSGLSQHTDYTWSPTVSVSQTEQDTIVSSTGVEKSLSKTRTTFSSSGDVSSPGGSKNPWTTRQATETTNIAGPGAGRDASREDLDPSVPEILWVGIGCAMFLTTAIACVLVFTRRSEARKERDSDSVRRFYIQPQSSCDTESSQACNGVSMSDSTNNVFSVSGRKFMTPSHGDIYCTIVDGDMMRVKSSSPGTAHMDNGTFELNKISYPLQPARRLETAKVGRCTGQLEKITYSNPRKEVLKSAADPPSNIVQTRTATTKCKDTGIHQANESLSHVYCRLNSKTEMVSGPQTHVPETYNVCGNLINGTMSQYCRPNDSLKERDMYCLAAMPSDPNDTLSYDDQNNDIEKSVEYSECSPLAVQPVSTWERNNGYFTLEDSGNIAISLPCATLSSQDPSQNTYSVIGVGGQNCEPVGESRLRATKVVITSPADNPRVDENPEKHYEELPWEYPIDKYNTRVSMADSEIEQDYFELESNAADSESDDLSTNSNGDPSKSSLV